MPVTYQVIHRHINMSNVAATRVNACGVFLSTHARDISTDISSNVSNVAATRVYACGVSLSTHARDISSNPVIWRLHACMRAVS